MRRQKWKHHIIIPSSCITSSSHHHILGRQPTHVTLGVNVILIITNIISMIYNLEASSRELVDDIGGHKE
ncbi:hypothetical protein HanHA300_Chr16g0600671 [Helianthus annuus]|nr:hypothetical protein HanHA300_Chr16g0600671 [Helianthus annuus]KAJ0459631.1 hypothetical protein HanHA89_Chr16g0651191 [Helianthus annuus]KAJ0640120.1 hypothetical protein HanLR1_Chr16g0611641 [Helianthus annuus]KAJ0644077.1 hypothetical protein HanOQP8_Chr16g0607871 [Helianthus annuus]